MCKICVKARALPPKEGLALIAEALSKGRSPEHFDKVTDELLGTGIPESDRELDAAWESKRRPSG